MKKIAITGMVILLVMFLVTCDEGLAKGDAAGEYTDVVYSADGSQITLYLDGVGVPKTQAQRAITRDLAKMAYDYFEVIFIAKTGTPGPTSDVIARAQWELGQSAGISGVPRGTGAPYTYGSSASPLALMAVGTKDQKTLLGVGGIVDVDGTGANGAITTAVDYVVFGLSSVKTGLKIGTPSVPADAAFDSLSFTTTSIKTAGTLSPLGDSNYPMYSLPTTSATQTATYEFGGAAATYKSELKIPTSVASPWDGVVERRIPRYMQNGRYLIPKGSINTKTTITVTSVAVDKVGFTFNVAGSGIFSFYIDVPVYLFSDTTGTNGGQLKAVTWHLRTGFGSELYSLDDGISSGGCVLMGVGVGSLDWLNIEWKWVN